MKIQKGIQHKLSEIEIYNCLIEETKDSIYLLTSELNLDSPDDVGILNWIYWETKINSIKVAESLGLKSSEMKKFIFPYEIDYTFKKCGHIVKWVKKSRSTDKPWRCSECDREQKKYWDEQHRKDSEKRAIYNKRMEELQEMPYYEYLKTPEWKARSLAAMKRAWFKCQLCGKDKVKLSTHHNTYENRGNEDRQDLIVLCEDCHEEFYLKKQKYNKGKAISNG